MDPNACLERWRRALAGKNRSEARAARMDLVGWLRSGGFWPKNITTAELAIFKRYHGLVPSAAANT
jgi:hypothetical protein